MLSNLKKMLVLIPCMILGLFLASSLEVYAADAVLVDETRVNIGGDNKENTYYFSNSKTWEFKAEYDIVWDYDTLLQYRVVRPDGSATAWIDDYYVDKGGVFVINDYTALSYTEKVDVSKRVSVAPAATYYVDIEYFSEYSRWSWTRKNQNKGEIIKIIVSGEDDTLNTPTANIKYNNQEKKYTVEASILKDGKGYGIITSSSYYFATEVKNNDKIYDFNQNKQNSVHKGDLKFTPASTITATFDAVESEPYKYVYAIVTTGNGYSKVVRYDIENSTSTPEQNYTEETDNSQDKPTGLFDYGFGELILLVLVVVLIVSCALIITQKIVDYKKRLY